VRKQIRDFFIFIAFLFLNFKLPFSRNAQKRDKKIEQNNRGREKNGGKKATFCVMSADGLFGGNIIAFFYSPCHETPKNAIKKSMKKK
jgi:hypothetical protein